MKQQSTLGFNVTFPSERKDLNVTSGVYTKNSYSIIKKAPV